MSLELPPVDEVDRRLRALESEVGELRETITRFADLVLGEVKDLRSTAQSPNANGLITPSIVSERPWLIVEIYREAVTAVRMYFDPRYRVRRSTQLMAPAIVGGLVVNYLMFNYFFAVPIISTVVEKLIDIVLAVMLYKIVTREGLRYRETLVEFAAWKDRATRRGGLILNGEAPAEVREIDS